jgi:hypothetical protein
MSCDLVETRMRIRPRESSLSHPFTASWFVPPSKGERTAPWLDRASNAVPARLAATLHDERNRSSTRDACDQLLPTTQRLRAPTFRSAIRAWLLRAASDAWRVFTTPHTLRVFRFVVRRGRFLPVASTELSPSDAPSPHTACPLRSRERRPPFPWKRRSLRAHGRDHLLAHVP